MPWSLSISQVSTLATFAGNTVSTTAWQNIHLLQNSRQATRHRVRYHLPSLSFADDSCSSVNVLCRRNFSTSRLFTSGKKKASRKNKAKKTKKEENDDIDDDEDIELQQEQEDFDVVEELYTVVTTDPNAGVHGNARTEAPFATSYHTPVMWKECVESLLGCERGKRRQQKNQENDDPIVNEATQDHSPLVLVDATLGGGGHSQALLEALRPGDVVFGCDVDADAIGFANERLSGYIAPAHVSPTDNNNKEVHRPLFVSVQTNFADINPQLLQASLAAVAPKHPCFQSTADEMFRVDGLLMDLGVSSYQIDTAERGFAFMKEGPLDMRMGRTGSLTAADLCNVLDFDELRRILRTYGDEPRAKAIVGAIINRRPLRTTQDLKDAVAAVTPMYARKGRRMGRTATLARVFQSLRIVVNQEDTKLERALTEMAPAVLRPGGRLAVLSYHSMEDRAAKRVIRDGTISKHEANKRNRARDVFGNFVGVPKPFRAVGKAQKATEEEIAVNVRARSATLRVSERTDFEFAAQE